MAQISKLGSGSRWRRGPEDARVLSAEMDYSDAAQVYISYEDHCSVVAECRRLLEELKCKYEQERHKMTTTIDCLRDQLEGVKLERQLWRKKFTEAHASNEEADKNSKKWTERVLDREKKLVRLRGELRDTLKCLEELVAYVEVIKEDNCRSSKQCIKDKVMAANWISRCKSARHKLNRVHQRYQGRVGKLRRKQSLLRVKLSRIKARYGRRIRSLLGRIDLLTAENQRLEIELREIVRQHEIRTGDEDEDEDGIGPGWSNRRRKDKNRPRAKQTTSRYR